MRPTNTLRLLPDAIDRAADPSGSSSSRARTLVDHAMEAIIAGAARGHILPGDRIIETEIAQSLGISRVPVREALRLLESQGLVVSEPYKGIRLIPVTRARLEQTLEVRVALECTAARRVFAPGRDTMEARQRLQRLVDAMAVKAARRDAYGLACTDTMFHRELCRLSGNTVLCSMWETLARQLTIIIGLSTLGQTMEQLVGQHVDLMEVFGRGDGEAIAAALDVHIRVQTIEIDFETLVEARRGARPSLTLAG